MEPIADRETKPSFRELSPDDVGALSDGELSALDGEMHETYAIYFGATARTTAPGAGRLSEEDLVNAHLWVIEELLERDVKHPPKDELDAATARLSPELARKVYGDAFVDRVLRRRGVLPEITDGTITSPAQKAGPSDRYAPIHPGSSGEHPRLALEDVEPHFKDFVLRDAAVCLVGSVCNNGETKNDVDVLIKGPLDEATRHIVEFRLGRMLPPEISQRVQFHGREGDPTTGAGPYTAYLPLFDIVFRRSEGRAIKEMRDESPFMEHAIEWVETRHLLDTDSDYNGMLGAAVLRMARLFSSEGHSGMSAMYARAYFNWLCDAYDGMHTMMLNDEDFKKAKATLAKRAVERIDAIIKQEDPHLLLPDVEEPRPAVLQAHIRGASVHGDFRIQTGEDFLTGWTLSIAKAGEVPKFSGKGDLERAAGFAKRFDADGSSWNKPMRAPFRIFATPKSVQPVVWREITQEAFPPGTVGGTRNEWGYIVRVAQPKVSFGVQKPYFHEYFVEGDEAFSGLLAIRLLTGKPGEVEEEVKSGRRTQAGEVFWVATFTKSLVPSVLKPRAVEVKTLPPLGSSALPPGIRNAIPEKYHYWKARSAKEMERVRNELVDAKIVTDETVSFDGNAFALGKPKGKAAVQVPAAKSDGPLFILRGPRIDRFSGAVSGAKPEGYLLVAEDRAGKMLKIERVPDIERAKRRAKVLSTPETRVHIAEGVGRTEEGPIYETIETYEPAEKALATLPFALVWQRWKGQIVIRAAPTKQIFHLFLERGASEVEDFQILADPTGSVKQATAIRRVLTGVDAKELLGFEGEAPPGKAVAGVVLNPSKNTPSTLSLLESGTVELLEDQRSFKKLRFKSGDLKRSAPGGIFVLVAEDVDSDIWLFERSAQPSRPIPGLAKAALSSSCGIAIEKAHEVVDGVQVWDPAKTKPTDDKGGERLELKPPALFAPQKPAPRKTNRFTSLDEAVKTLSSSEELMRIGYAVEPKYNGFRVVLEKWIEAGKPRSWLFTEEAIKRRDTKTDLLDGLPSVRKEVESLPGDFVLDCEFTAVDEHDEVVPRTDLARFRGGRVEGGDAGVRLKCFQLLFHDGKNFTALSYEKMRSRLEDLLDRENLGHLEIAPIFGVAKNVKDLDRLAREAAREPGSEGAMFKHLESTYSLGGENDLWAKVKISRSVTAIVLERHEVKGSPGVFNFTGGIGPVSAEEARGWAEVRELEGKRWVVIGVTGNRKLEASVGDTILVDLLELAHKPTVPKRIRWFGPAQAIEVVPGKPSTVAETLEQLEPSETKKISSDVEKALEHGYDVRLLKREATEERYVLGVVLEPIDESEPDAQGDFYDEEEVRQTAHRYMEFYRNMGIMHRELAHDNQIRILESYLAPVAFDLEGQHVRKGTWLLGSRIVDDELWEQVKAGEFTGYSIGGSAVREPT